MQVLDFEEQEDGSAIITLDLSDTEKRLLIEDALRRILLEKAKADIEEFGGEVQPKVQQGEGVPGQEEGLPEEAEASKSTGVKELPYA